MSDINSESLKQLAEYMGYGVDVRPFDETVYVHDKGADEKLWPELHIEYDPISNTKQCLELQHKFRAWVTWPRKDWCQVMINKDGAQNIGEGKTINEAVTNAAIAAIGEKNET